MKVGVILLVLCASCIYAAPVSFTGNVSLKGDKDSWSYRKTNMIAWDYDPIDGDGARFNSISAGRTKYSAEGDAMWGEASITTSYPPTAWLAFATWGVYNTSDDWQVSGAKGYVANAYLSLEETAPNGTVVRRQSLREGFLDSALSWDTSDKGVNGLLKYISFVGTVASEPWQIELTFVVSDVVGVIDKAHAVVTPKSLESIVSITNWPYLDTANTLTLVMAVATGEARAKGSAVISGSDSTQVYFSLASKAIVGGEKKDVHVSSFTSGDFNGTFENAGFKAQLHGVYGSKAAVKVVRVTFPAGASNILYDPTLGSGEVPAEEEEGASNAAALTTARVLVVVVCACIAALWM